MPEDPLRGWQGWNLPFERAPRLIRELTRGRTNRTYLIEVDDRRWVLRLSTPNIEYLGIDRNREAAILACAAAAGIAPRVAHCSVKHGILVTEYIDGYHWSADALVDPENFESLLALVSRVHTLDIDAAPIDYYAHAEQYWQRLINARADIPQALYRERDRILTTARKNPNKRFHEKLCHHDLTPANIIDQNGRLYLLDWEYATLGSPAFDYAAMAIEWDVPMQIIENRCGIELGELTDAASLYRLTCQLWALLNGSLSEGRA